MQRLRDSGTWRWWFLFLFAVLITGPIGNRIWDWPTVWPWAGLALVVSFGVMLWREHVEGTAKWSYPGLVDGWLVGDDRLRGAPPLIRGGGEIAECGVSPVHVVEPFDVIK
jgi:hypothetical protein